MVVNKGKEGKKFTPDGLPTFFNQSDCSMRPRTWAWLGCAKGREVVVPCTTSLLM